MKSFELAPICLHCVAQIKCGKDSRGHISDLGVFCSDDIVCLILHAHKRFVCIIESVLCVGARPVLQAINKNSTMIIVTL